MPLSAGAKGPESTNFVEGEIMTVTGLLLKKETKYGEQYVFETSSGNKRTTSKTIIGRLTGPGAGFPVKIEVFGRKSQKSSQKVLDVKEVA